MADQSNTVQKTRELIVIVLLAFLGPCVGALLSILLVMFPPTERPDVVLWLGIGISVIVALLVLVIGLPALQRRGWIHSWTAILRLKPAIVLLVSLTAAGYATNWLIDQSSVVVPGFVGKTYVQAISELRDLGLTQGEIYRAPTADDYTRITQQKPLAGTEVMSGATIDMIVGVLEVTIEITSPVDGETVTQEQVIVKGTSKGVAESGGRLHANLFLQPLAADGYWVYGPLTIGDQGEWKKVIFLGQGTSTLPQNYQILALVTMELLKAQGSGNGQPEYMTIPRHAAKSQVVTVTRTR
ncbi:MAG: PASTA domain-containing protein [Sedimentisphaerales bacterium]